MPGRMTPQQAQEYQAQMQQKQMEQQLAAMAQQMETQLNALIEKNRAGLTELQRKSINFDPGQVLNARIDVLIQSIANALGPQGIIWALQARTDFEEHIAVQVDKAGNEGRRAQLAMGGSFSPQMIRQLAAETNTFGGLH